MADLIPAGRTSLVNRGNTPLQVQTEYAYRPMPRITTTILKKGQVLHKIELTLESPIADIEEKNRMEITIRKQHAEIVALIRDDIPIPTSSTPATPVPPEPKPYPEPGAAVSTSERLQLLPGRHRVYRLDNEGNFVNASVSKEFARLFKPIFKNLHELISIFGSIPGVGLTRESGVYEVVRDTLYLISTGTELYFLCVQQIDLSINYEKEIRAVLAI